MKITKEAKSGGASGVARQQTMFGKGVNDLSGLTPELRPIPDTHRRGNPDKKIAEEN